jgi:hypothetical protein
VVAGELSVTATTIGHMDLQARIAEAEDANEALLAKLIAGSERLLEDLTAFRAEFRAGLNYVKTSLRTGFGHVETKLGGVDAKSGSLTAGLSRTQELLDEILRRLPEREG